MATAKINIKNIDYFKFKKIVIDGNRDDYANCSKEVKAMCDSVQTLTFRDEEFDVQSDRSRFEEVCTYYHQILQSKRIDPVDMRIKSGWWGDHKTGYSAGKIKPAVLLEVLVAKTKDWAARHGGIQTSMLEKVEEKIEGPGLYVFKHKEHQCFQYIGRAENVFAKCGETLKAAFEGSITDPLAALLVISMSTDWDFYFIPVSASGMFSRHTGIQTGTDRQTDIYIQRHRQPHTDTDRHTNRHTYRHRHRFMQTHTSRH